MESTTLVILVIAAALIFDFTNGWNDSANSIATVVSTRVLRPFPAIAFAAVFNFAGAFASTKIARMVGTGIIDPNAFSGPLELQPVLFSAMVAAAAWVAFCTLRGLPISASHSLIGALIGAATAIKGTGPLVYSGIAKIAIALFISPLLGFALAYVLLVLVFRIAYGLSFRAGQQLFGKLQIASSALISFEHGQNDAQKVMGVVAIALFAGGFLHDSSGAVITDAAHLYIPTWVIVACGSVIALGTLVGGWRVIKTLGTGLAKLTPVEGFAAEAGASVTLQLAAALGVPVSTTHTITGAILGVGSVASIKAVRWTLGAKIIYAWIFTLPATFGVAYVTGWAVHRWIA